MLWKGFQRPKRLEVERETLTPTFGCFHAQPFERGFGTTIGNALRRVLLSSIEGAAITAVKIEGVLHEFSSIPGVVEDTTDIILNLKQIPFRIHCGPPGDAHADRRGPGRRARAGHPADVERRGSRSDRRGVHAVRGGQDLDGDAASKRGRGYVPADRNFDEDLGIGYIPLDSVHSPVRKVNFTRGGRAARSEPPTTTS